jgi:predicted patatin/cPLA2 family phospholipase
MHERLESGSRRGERTDGRILALAVEGGGMRGSISAGECLGLEALGLIDTIDVVYGTSSGALNASYAAAGQAAIGASNYEDSTTRQFIDPWRLLKGEKIVDFDFLFDEIIRGRKPYDKQGLREGPDFRTLATDMGQKSLELLRDFSDLDDMMQAVRASCSIPFLSNPTYYRGSLFVDGGLLEPVPYRAALDEGATDVLALRTRPATVRKSAEPLYARQLVSRFQPEVLDLVKNQPELYNQIADDLERRAADGDQVFQVTPPVDVVDISRTERSLKKVRLGMEAGTQAVAEAFGVSSVKVLWQPVAYTA